MSRTHTTSSDHPSRDGFTLLELMIVVTIIGLIAAIAIPAFDTIRRRSRINTFTNDLRVYEQAFATYEADNPAQFPNSTSSDGQMPEGMEGLLPDEWASSRPVGGVYLWIYNDADPSASQAYIQVRGTSANPLLLDDESLEEVDANLDDGNPRTGRLNVRGTRIRLYVKQ